MSKSPIRRQPFSAESLEKYNNAVREALNEVSEKPIEDLHVYISVSNSKTGDIPSFSTISGITCSGCNPMCQGGCGWYCYDKSSVIRMGRKNILKSRAINTKLMYIDPARAFSEISKECYKYRYFRWHVGGEIINRDYFFSMCKVARENPHCQFLVFTKNHNAVNEAVSYFKAVGDDVPENMHVVFSIWPGMKHDNPYGFPEASPMFHDGTSAFDSIEGASLCSGSCQDCLSGNCGCFNAKPGDKILFNLH